MVTTHHSAQVRLHTYPLRPRLRKALRHPRTKPAPQKPSLRPWPVHFLLACHHAGSLIVGVVIATRMASFPPTHRTALIRRTDLGKWYLTSFEISDGMQRIARAGLATIHRVPAGFTVTPHTLDH